MRWLGAIGREMVGLFVDDRCLALAIVLWLAVVALVLPTVGVPPGWRGFALFVGLAITLSWSCLHHTSRHVSRSHARDRGRVD